MKFAARTDRNHAEIRDLLRKLCPAVADTGRLIRNAVRWCAGQTNASPRIAVHARRIRG